MNTKAKTPQAAAAAAEQLPCAACGVSASVTASGAIESVILGTEWAKRPGINAGDQTVVSVVARFALCPTCAARRELAEAIADANPRTSAWFGQREYAVAYVEAILTRADVLGSTGVAFALASDERALRLALAREALVVTWARSARVTLRGERTMRPNAEPFAHIDEEARAAAREAFASWMAARLERPRRYRPPADSDLPACMYCGRAEVEALPSEPGQGWSEGVEAQRRLLGGGAGKVWGYLCRDCDRAANGSIGARSLLAAAAAHIGLRPPRDYDGPIKAWAVTGRAPGEPWEWIDLDMPRVSLLIVGAGKLRR